MKTLRVRLTFTEPLLGTSPANKDIYRDFVAAKAPDAALAEEETEGLEEAVQGGTVFHRLEDGTPCLYDYHIKGFFKAACGALKRAGAPVSSKIKAHKKEIDLLVFPEPRRIPIRFDGLMGECQRPLRAQTAKGERVSLAISEEIPAGATVEFSVSCLKDDLIKAVEEWLDYGRWSGIGQWRNSGKGRFTWEKLGEG